MFCMMCGTQLPDDAAFCDMCGASQQGTPTAEPAASRGQEAPQENDASWELCEIELRCLNARAFGPTTWHFRASVQGPKGRYSLSASSEFKLGYFAQVDKTMPDPGSEIREAFEDILSTISPGEWDPVPQGEAWYSYRFRRRVQ